MDEAAETPNPEPRGFTFLEHLDEDAVKVLIEAARGGIGDPQT